MTKGVSGIPTGPGTGVASPSEVGAAVEALGEIDLARLRAFASRRLRGCRPAVLKGREWKDLINEAIVRTLDGRRTWEKSVSFVTHLLAVMRSIASAWEQEAASDPAVPASALAHETEDGEGMNPYVEAPSSHADPERCAAGKEDLARLIEHFKEDPVASLVITCRMNGSALSDLSTELGISERECEAARKRVMRYGIRASNRGEKS